MKRTVKIQKKNHRKRHLSPVQALLCDLQDTN